MPSRLGIALLSLVVPVIAVILELLPATRQWCQGILPTTLRRKLMRLNLIRCELLKPLSEIPDLPAPPT